MGFSTRLRAGTASIVFLSVTDAGRAGPTKKMPGLKTLSRLLWIPLWKRHVPCLGGTHLLVEIPENRDGIWMQYYEFGS